MLATGWVPQEANPEVEFYVQMFIKECSLKDGEEVRGQRKSQAMVPAPLGDLELRGLFTVIVTWTKVTRPLYTSVPRLLHSDHLRQRSSLQLEPPL